MCIRDRLRYMSNGQLKVPLIIRTVTGGGGQLGATHSQSLEVWFATVPGLKVIVPSDPYDALGLLRTAMKDDDPVIFAEHALLYRIKGEVPTERYEIPLGQATLKRTGSDITLVAYSRMVHVALEAAEILSEKGIDKIEKLSQTYGILKNNNFYDPQNINLVHHINQALKANLLFLFQDHQYLDSPWKHNTLFSLLLLQSMSHLCIYVQRRLQSFELDYCRLDSFQES